MADYAFTTRWHLDAPIEAVWKSIRDSEKWPTWWRSVRKVEKVRPGNADGVGEVRRYTWKGRLPYSLTFDMTVTRIEPLRMLAGTATGELAGNGVWRFDAAGPGTTVRYDWNVRATKRWMRLLAPVARPIFAWNHDAVMRDGEAGLARLLGSGR